MVDDVKRTREAGRRTAVTLNGLGLAALPRIACAPWWAVFLLSVLGFIAICLLILIPDDSADKLALLRDIWNARNDRKRRDR